MRHRPFLFRGAGKSAGSRQSSGQSNFRRACRSKDRQRPDGQQTERAAEREGEGCVRQSLAKVDCRAHRAFEKHL